MEKIIDFKEVYRFPLKYVEDCPFMVLTADDHRAFDFEWEAWETYEMDSHIDGKSIHDIIAKLNGDNSIILENYYNFSYNNSKIWAFNTNDKKKKHIMLIRGWGHLIGTGGLHLKVEDAAKIQDDFGQYIVDTLNK